MTEKRKKEVRTKQMTATEWAEAKALYRTGDVTMRELSARFNVSIATLSKRFKKDQVVKGESAIERRVEEEVTRQALDEAEVTAKRIRETREESYTWMRTVARMTVAEVAAAHKDKRKPCKDTLSAMQAAANVLKTAQEQRSKLLGMDRESSDEEGLPELVMRELTPEEQDAARNAFTKDDPMPAELEEEFNEMGADDAP